jgi:hypothetical protein
MRTAAFIFFLFLCFHMISGKSDTHARVLNGMPVNQSLQRGQLLKNLQVKDDETVFKNDDSVEETSLIGVEDDDEDFITRKLTMLTRYVVAFTSVFILLVHVSSPISRLPFLQHLSCLGSPKYIVLRVLKI